MAHSLVRLGQVVGRRSVRVRLHALPVCLALSAVAAGCPVPPDGQPGSAGQLVAADILEVEPNDRDFQDLGVIEAPLVVGGSASACGSDGSYEGSDVDRFSFSVAEPSLFSLRLEVLGGDLDLRLYDPDGDLMAVEDTPGIEPEEVELSIGPGGDYGAELLCWLGDSPDWRLVFADGAQP